MMTLSEKKAYIDHLDFSDLLKKLTNTVAPKPYSHYWTPDQAKAAIQRYKNYLYLLVKYRDQYDSIPPTLEIDEIWHNHILETRRYHADCNILFGEYLHHYPYFGLDTVGMNEMDHKLLSKAFSITLLLYYAEFNTVLIDPKEAEIIAHVEKHTE